jgi:hypothetical protein
MKIMYSNSNSIVKSFRHRSITTSDVGESLYDEDLEWDKSDFTRHLPESDALSSYDINEMTEILRNRFLEFDMSSQIGGRSTQSPISDIFTPTANQDLTTEEFLQNQHGSSKRNFDLEFFYENQIIKRPFHRSLPDFRSIKQRKSSLLSKHISLMDIKSIQWTFLKHTTPRTLILTRGNDHISLNHLLQSMEIEPESESERDYTNPTVNFSRLSKLAMIRLFIRRLAEKVSSIISETFEPIRTSIITEEIIETYDIIEK